MFNANVRVSFDEKGVFLVSKVVFITGASRGIGRATALAFAKAGYRVACTARDLGNTVLPNFKLINTIYAGGSLQETVRMIERLSGEVLALQMDLLSRESVDKAIAQVYANFGCIDVVINNAIYQGPDLNASLLDLTPRTLENVSRAYILAPLQIAQSLIPQMVQQGSGCIINITSGAGEKDPPIPAAQGGWGYAYGAGKAAVSRLSGIISREHGKQGIRAFTVNPGVVNTETLRATISEQGIKSLGQSLCEPELIAEVLLWIVENSDADNMQYQTIDAQRLARHLKL
jgi:3-oxoacyl-[acyl-carrier protein] reductase